MSWKSCLIIFDQVTLQNPIFAVCVCNQRDLEKTHVSIRGIDKATHTLHIDIAGPFAPSDDGYSYLLVGALHLPGFSSSHRCSHSDLTSFN